jgi:uncharacterized membrane protein YgcG
MRITKKLLAGLVLVFAACLFFIPSVSKAGVDDFTISNFEADYSLTKDANGAAQLKTIETITADFPDFDQNHGLLRAIPKKYLDKNLHLNVESVKDPAGVSLAYTTYTENDNLVLKIGDASKYVHGQQTYVITYNQNNVVRFFENQDEWYWNVDGVQGAQPITVLTARIHIPSSLVGLLKTDKACYIGVQDSRTANCSWQTNQSADETVLTLNTTKAINAGETASFVLAFDKNTFTLLKQTFWEKYGSTIFLITGILGIVLIPLLTFIVVFKKWRKYGRDPKGRGTIIPEYQAPKNLSVLGSSAIYSESVPSSSFSAQIVGLAIKGYIRIEETEKDKLIGKSKQYGLTLLKLADNKLTTEESSLLNGIFESQQAGSTVLMDDLKNKFYIKVTEISKALMEALTSQGYFVKNPQKAKTAYIVAGSIMFFTGVITAALLFGIGLMLAGILCFIFAFIMPARTVEGLKIKEHLEGLKLYIGTAEKDRFEFLQSVKGAERVAIPEKDNASKIKLFEDLLPYAMLFKMEKSWAKQFEGIYVQPPNWYQGNWTTFNTAYLASSLGSFNSTSASSFAAPSSSSGSGFSGGAGGGGGGGGTGGW